MDTSLNFSARAPRWPLLLLLPTLVLCAVLALSWRAQLQQRAQVEQLESRATSRLVNNTRLPAARSPARTTPLPLLQALETAWGDDVALLRLEIEPDTARTRLTLRARSQGALQDFVTRLRKAGVEARLLSQESLPTDGALSGAQSATMEIGA